MADTLSVSFSLDGNPLTVNVEPRASTLDVLREQLGVFACKGGCAPQGLCGCCTVLINGAPRLSCTLPIKTLQGKSVTTLSGLPEEAQNRLADAFVATGASQCGYCTPGILLSCHALLNSKPSPTEEEVARALNQHLCRCTGYTAIHAAVQLCAAQQRGEAEIPVSQRPEGRDIALGRRPFVDDLCPEGALMGALVFAPTGAGRIVSIESSAAEEMPGVSKVIRLRQVGDILEGPKDAVAAVLAVDGRSASRAAALVKIEISAIPAPESTVVAKARRAEGQRGELGLRYEERFSVPYADPGFLEPEAAVAIPGQPLTVYTAAEDAGPQAGLRVRMVPSGGSYGGKRWGIVEETAILLAKQSQRPVRVGLSMEEGMRLHPKRPAAQIAVQAALNPEGGLALLDIQLLLKGGPCLEADLLVAQALGACPYQATALALEVQVEEGEGPAIAAIRGGSAVPLAFAVEQSLNALAKQSGQDALALRRHALQGDARTILDALEPAYLLEDGQKGLAVVQMDGAGGAKVVLHILSASEIEVFCNVPELGQGRDATLLKTLMESTGLPASVFVFPFGEAERVGPAAAAAAPVDGAARRAGEALAQAGGPLSARIGQVFEGEDGARAPMGVVAALAVLVEGQLKKIYLAAACGAQQDQDLLKNLCEGAALMGTGLALSEEVVWNGLPETRLRMLGMIKPKNAPEIIVLPVILPGGTRDAVDVAVAASTAAVANSLAAGPHLPLRDTAAAKAIGARPSK